MNGMHNGTKLVLLLFACDSDSTVLHVLYTVIQVDMIMNTCTVTSFKGKSSINFSIRNFP